MVTPRIEKFMEHFTTKVDTETHPNGCWYFTGAKSSNGYGNSWHAGEFVSSHRLSYIIFCGEIPPKMDVDHLCHTRDNCVGGASCSHRLCVRPSHLGLKTHRENLLRGRGKAGDNIRKTHCVNGHEFSSENTRIQYNKKSGRDFRVCRECGRISDRKIAQRKKFGNTSG